jgi:predicted house-cleaning noncanonical NTP pyrophosphatase (MazG superfamily)
MNLNDVLNRHNVLTKIELKNGDKELSKELKVKIMRIRMAFTKIRKQFDEDTEEFAKQIVSDELRELSTKQERTQEENDRFNELNSKANSEYQEYLVQKGLEEVEEPTDSKFTEEEFADILDINAGNDVEINNVKVKATDLMEIFYTLFV